MMHSNKHWDINCETSFVEAATGRYNDQSRNKDRNQNKQTKRFISGIRYKCNEHQINKTGPETDPGTDHLTDHQAKIIHSIHLKTLGQITETTVTRTVMTATTGRTTAETMAGTETTNNNQDTNRENQNYANRYDNNQDRNRYDNNQDRYRFNNRRRPKQIQTPQKPTQSSSHLQILRPKRNGNDADGKRIH